MSSGAKRIGSTSVLSLFLASGSLLALGTPSPCGLAGESIRGITVSTHRGGREWGDPAVMGPTLDELVGISANWLAVHPYAGIGADGSVRWRNWEEAPPHYTTPVDEAHERGLRILIKPHIAYWGSPFSWRGEISFGDDEAAWKRFFDSYEEWIVAAARASTDADLFAVGTELDGTTHRPEWLRIVAAVREVTDVPLTFASNWTDYERLPFWPELDLIGIQAYFPLGNERSPERATVRSSWRHRMEQLRPFAERNQRPIVFTELGYARAWSAATEPWKGADEKAAEPLQLLLLEEALRAVEHEPVVLGAYLWKWFPEPRPIGRDFALAAPAVRQLLSRMWHQPPSSSPAHRRLSWCLDRRSDEGSGSASEE